MEENGEVELLIAVNARQYEYYADRSAWLACLEAAGVKEWEGYTKAEEIRDGRRTEEPIAVEQ